MPAAKPAPTVLTKQPVPLRYCPRCFRVEPELGVEFCGNFALGCPEPVTPEPGTTVTVKCPLEGCHGKVRSIPVGNIMQRRHLDELGACSRDQCAASVILPSPPASTVKAPPPISGE